MYQSVRIGVDREFARHFAVARATSDTLKDQCFAIRHKVYCEELGYEPVRPNGLEQDAYDATADHILVQSHAAGAYIGCARVIVRPSGQRLPLEAACGISIDDSNGPVGEISRFAVLASFRRRRGEAERPISLSEADFGTEQRPRFPHIPIALYFGAIAAAEMRRLHALAVLTERRLASHFVRGGIMLEQIGPPVHHRGERVPYVIRVRQTIDALGPGLAGMYQMIRAAVMQPPA